MLNKLQKIVPLRLELIPFALLIFIIYFTAVNFTNLPDSIPTHFNFEGQVDGNGGKNGILIFPGMGLFIYLLFTGIILALASVHDPKTMINLPDSVKSRITPEKAELLRVLIVRTLFVLKLTIMSLNAFLVYGSVEIALNQWSSLGYWPMLFLVPVLGLVFLMIYGSFRLAYSK
jgi:uncharacterized membrane protein